MPWHGDNDCLYKNFVLKCRKNLMISVDQSRPHLLCSWLETTFFPFVYVRVAIGDMLSPSK